MTDLPDVSVWIALVDERHVHHALAKRYWVQASKRKIVFSRITMLGFLRLSTSHRVIPNPLSAREAWEIYSQFLSLPFIHFLPDPPNTENFFRTLTLATSFPQRLWTDAYLAAFALASGCRLVSFDSDFQRFPDIHFLHLSPSNKA